MRDPQLGDDAAVSVKVSGPKPWQLEQLNLSIGGLNDACAAVERIGELIKSLDGFNTQLNSSAATPRHAALLAAEAKAVAEELQRSFKSDALRAVKDEELDCPINSAAPAPRDLERARKTKAELEGALEKKRAVLNHELAVLETAHLNSESSLSAIRDLDRAFGLVSKTRKELLNSPGHALEACGALGGRARALLLND